MTVERQPPAKLFRFAISVLVIGHLLAVILPPLSFQTGQSPSVATALAPVEGYGQFLYINRGYAFFAPEPGPSHLLQAAITDRNGQQVERTFPDLNEQWPRLLYHRHFMITEFLQEIYRPPGPPLEFLEVDPVEAELWAASRSRYEHVLRSVADHLEHEHPGQDVAIRRVEHLVPGLVDFLNEPIELTDPRLYQVMQDEPVELGEGGDLAAPVGPPESIPPPAASEADTSTDAVDQDDGAPVPGKASGGSSEATGDAVEPRAADAAGGSS